MFGSRGSEGCRESWAKALLAKSKPIVDRRDSSVKYYEHPKLLDRYGREGVKEINGWINRLHVARKGIERYGGETEFSYVIVVGDAERSSLYDSGSGVLGAREKLGIVYAFVSKVIENGDSSLDLLEEIQSNTEKWKGRCMASYSSIFVSKTTRVSAVDRTRSISKRCSIVYSGVSGLTVSEERFDDAFEIRVGLMTSEREGVSITVALLRMMREGWFEKSIEEKTSGRRLR